MLPVEVAHRMNGVLVLYVQPRERTVQQLGAAHDAGVAEPPAKVVDAVVEPFPVGALVGEERQLLDGRGFHEVARADMEGTNGMPLVEELARDQHRPSRPGYEPGCGGRLR